MISVCPRLRLSWILLAASSGALLLAACAPPPEARPVATVRQALSCPTSQIDTHTSVCDASGKLLSWAAPASPDQAFDTVIGLNVGYFTGLPLETVTDRNGANPLSLPPFYGVSYLCSGVSPGCSPAGSPVGWPQNNAGLAQMLTESGLDLYAYDGDTRLIDLATAFLLHHLDHALTPAGASWSQVPFTDGKPGQYDFHGDPDFTNGVGDGDGYLEPEKVAAMGYAYAQAYQYDGNTRFRDAAVHLANQLFAHQRTTGLSSTVSPWFFRTRATDDVPRAMDGERYASNVVDALRLYTEVLRLGSEGRLTGAPEYSATAQANWSAGKSSALGWLLGPSGPIQDADHAWCQYFEDVPGMSDPHWNLNQLVPMETAKYLMDHPEDDPSWQTHVAGLLSWVKENFGTTAVNGATPIAEQFDFFHAMASHTARYAAVRARYAELTQDASSAEEAFRSFNWATYMVHDDGLTVDGPEVENVWFSDSLGDFLRHFFIGMGALPDFAPSNASHLLRASSVVTSVSYLPASLSYQTAQAQGREVLRLSFPPSTVTAGGVALAQVTDLDASEGWTFDTSADRFGNPRNVLRIRHDQSGAIAIHGSTTLPVVAITSPTGQANFAAPATLSLSANVILSSGRTLAAGSVKFYAGATLLCSAPQTQSPFSCTATSSLADGAYTILAKATDSASETGSATADITVAGAPTVQITSPPDGATVGAGAVTLSASAAAGTGRALTSVTFLNGSTVLCTADASPFTCTWSASVGSATLTAVATDDGTPARSTPSAAVHVTVAASAPSGTVLLGDKPAVAPTTVDYEDPQTVDFWQLTASASGPVGVLGIYLDGSSTASSVALGVYSDVGGAPDTLLSRCTAPANPGTGGWITCSAAPTASLVSGQSYFLAVLSPTSGESVHWREASSGGGTYAHSGGGQASLGATAATVTGSWPGNGIAAFAATAGTSNPPAASLTSPATGSNYAATANVSLVASAAANGGHALTTVEFLQAGVSTPVCTVHNPGAGTVSCSVTLTDGAYAFSVRATDDAGQATTSQSVNLTVSNPPTVSITSPASGATVGAGSVTLAANATAGTGRTVSSVTFKSGGATLCTAAQSPFTCVWTAATGSYTLTAVATDNGSPAASTTSASVQVTVTATPTVPAAPSGLSVAAISSSELDLTWTDNSTDETGFQVERAPDVAGAPGTWTTVGTVGANVTHYADTGLAAATRYWFRVRATNAAGASSPTGAVSQTTAAGASGTVLLGNATLAAADDLSGQGTAEAFHSTAIQSGVLTQLKVYVGAAESTSFEIGLYTDDGGAPGAKLGACTVTSPAANAWNGCALATGVSISQGTVYWIAVLSTQGGALHFRDDGVPGFGGGGSFEQGGLATLPGTFSPGAEYTSSGASFYGTN